MYVQIHSYEHNALMLCSFMIGLAAYTDLPGYKRPYGGVDTRLYFSRPLVKVADMSNAVSSSRSSEPSVATNKDKNYSSGATKVLLLDTKRGVYYRYITDSLGDYISLKSLSFHNLHLIGIGILYESQTMIH